MRTAVAREFDFGNDLDVALGCVGGDVADLLFGKAAVLAAVRLRHAPFWVNSSRHQFQRATLGLPLGANAAHSFCARQAGQSLLDKFRLHEMPATIQQQSSVGKPRRISKVSARQGAITRQRQRTQRGQSVKHPVR